MITEKEISAAAFYHADATTIRGEIPFGIDDTEALQESFINGIGWFKKSIWHDARE